MVWLHLTKISLNNGMASTGGNVMRLKFKEKVNNLITNKVDLGEIVNFNQEYYKTYINL